MAVMVHPVNRDSQDLELGAAGVGRSGEERSRVGEQVDRGMCRVGW